jgi:hypothetical protein
LIYGAALLLIRLVDSSFSITMTKTWLNVGSGGAGVGVGAGVAVGIGVGVGVGVGRGVAVGTGFVLGVGVGLLTAAGVSVECAALVGFAAGVPALPGVAGIEDRDGASANGGCDVGPGTPCGPSNNDVIHKSNPPTAAQRTNRRSNHMSGTSSHPPLSGIAVGKTT